MQFVLFKYWFGVPSSRQLEIGTPREVIIFSRRRRLLYCSEDLAWVVVGEKEGSALCPKHFEDLLVSWEAIHRESPQSLAEWKVSETWNYICYSLEIWRSAIGLLPLVGFRLSIFARRPHLHVFLFLFLFRPSFFPHPLYWGRSSRSGLLNVHIHEDPRTCTRLHLTETNIPRSIVHIYPDKDSYLRVEMPRELFRVMSGSYQ